jgi:hypothetical protein
MARAKRVEITGRGFRQNAANAMRNDIVRGLIELITNADDAYGANAGDIRIDFRDSDIDGFAYEIAVRDRATGLNADEIEANFFKIGAATSNASHGGTSRGFFGRGAKDVTSFGSARFAAVKNGLYSEVLIDRDGNGTWLAEDRAATSEDLETLRLNEGESGLTATIIVESADASRPAPLARKLGSHVQLRELCRRRVVEIRDTRGGAALAATADALDVTGEIVLDATIDLAGAFKPVHLMVLRLPSQERGAVNEYSQHGILVTDGNATHMNSLFGMEGRPAAGFIAGSVSCPEIREILRATSEEDGGASLISLTRDGLMASHPYTRALTLAIQEHIRPIIDAIAAETGSASDTSEQLRKDMEDARRAMRDELKAILREIEDESSGGDGDDTPPLQFIPDRISVGPGGKRSLTLRIRNDIDGGPAISVESLMPPDCILVDDVSDTTFSPHDRLDVRSGVVRLSAVQIGTAKVVARVGNATAECFITVEEADRPPEPAPDGLEFRPDRARISPERKRHLRLVAPITFDERTAVLTTDGSVPHEVPAAVDLHETPDGSMLEAIVTLRAGTEKGEVRVGAATAGDTADCAVTIADPASDIGLDWDVQIQHDHGAFPRASRYRSGETLMIEIWGEDPSVKPILGKWDSEANAYDQAESPAARAMLAEIVSLELAAHLTETAAERPKYAQRLREADRALQMQRDFQARLARICHRALAPATNR